MRKIFSAALALVCIWFATPAFANCNLFDPSAVPSSAFAVQGDGTVSNTITDTRTSFRIQTNITANGTNRALFYGDLETPGNYVKTFTIPEGTTSIIIKHNGTTKDIFLWSPNASVLAPGTYTLSFDILSSNPSVVGGLQLKNIQIERGSAATPYTPYNPLCATCNGTIVNYVSATGTVSQSGTPTPTNPIYPTFYKQGDMVLRKVGNYKDSYDATTGKITRRVAVVVFDGTESWGAKTPGWEHTLHDAKTGSDGLMLSHFGFRSVGWSDVPVHYAMRSGTTFRINYPEATTAAEFKSWLAQQYAAGTPVTVYYPLAEETTEDWPASYCETPIKIATTKYNETAFSPLNTALQNAISVVDTVVSNTITQAGRIATLQAQKQTRPNDIADDSEKCPAGKKCLLVEDASGVPHWYEIVENAWDLPVGYTQLQYIESTGEQYLDLGYAISKTMSFEIKSRCLGAAFVFGGRASSSSAVSGMNYDQSGSKIGIRMGSVILYDTLVWQEGTDYTVSIQNGNVSIDGRTVSSATYGNDYYTGKAYLFATNDNGHLSPTVYNKNRIYYFKMYNNNTLTQNLIPAKNSSGVVGMYDTVSGTFFTNAGDGEFTAGPVAE